MAIKPKQILDTAVDLGKAAVSAAERRLRSDESATDRRPSTPSTPAAKTVPEAGGTAKAKSRPSGSPSTVGAAKPGKPRGHKSATASTTSATARPPAGKAKPPAAKPKRKPKPKAKAIPRKRAAGTRTTASQAAASSGKEVSDAASGKSD